METAGVYGFLPLYKNSSLVYGPTQHIQGLGVQDLHLTNQSTMPDLWLQMEPIKSLQEFAGILAVEVVGKM